MSAEGWGRVAGAYKAHLFVNGVSLCGRWTAGDTIELAPGNGNGPEFCQMCQATHYCNQSPRRQAKLRKKQRRHPPPPTPYATWRAAVLVAAERVADEYAALGAYGASGRWHDAGEALVDVASERPAKEDNE